MSSLITLTPPKKKEKIVIFGDGGFAQVCYQYFTYDSEYEVAGFCVDRDYLKQNSLFGLPVIAYDEVKQRFPPNQYGAFVAILFTQLNKIRTERLAEFKAAGYKMVSYISSRSLVWPDLIHGEHCFIWEGNKIQPFVKLGNNVILGSGNIISHNCVIGDNVFISHGVVIAGSVNIGKNCFIAINSSLVDRISIGDNCFISAGSIVRKNLPANTYLKSPKSDYSDITAQQYFGIA